MLVWFSFISCEETNITIDEDMDEVPWYVIDGIIFMVRPWIAEPRRPTRCQLINTHSMSLSKVLNCNTNIQIGEPCQIFYTTLYSNKDTQKEDCETPQRVQQACSKKLLKIEGQTLDGIRQLDNVQDGFIEGMFMVLVAMYTATSIYRVSTV